MSNQHYAVAPDHAERVRISVMSPGGWPPNIVAKWRDRCPRSIVTQHAERTGGSNPSPDILTT
jgi:hypothetical protein